MNTTDKIILAAFAFIALVSIIAAFYPTEKPKNSWWHDED